VENQPEDVESPYAQDPTPQRDSGSISPQVRVPTPLRETGRDSPTDQANNEGPRIRRSEHRRIRHRYFQLEDEVFLCTPLEVDEPTSFKEAVDSPNHKQWMNAMKDETQWQEIRFENLFTFHPNVSLLETSGFSR